MSMNRTKLGMSAGLLVVHEGIWVAVTDVIQLSTILRVQHYVYNLTLLTGVT